MQEKINLSEAGIYLPGRPCPVVKKAAQALSEEIGKRTGKPLKIAEKRPERGLVILLATKENLEGEDAAALSAALPGEAGEEGYRAAAVSNKKIIVEGNGARGVLYGAGKLLRSALFAGGKAELPSGFAVLSTPAKQLRGHQLGYRPKTNAYDAWTPEQYDQYIRELALFGANSIEIIPDKTDDDYDSPHFHTEPKRMLRLVSAIIKSYGMDVWLWYPNMAKDYEDGATVARELADREEIFSGMPYIDHLSIPGGDPGDVDCEVLFPWLSKVNDLLVKYHPEAKIWLSPQYFAPAEGVLESFYREVGKKPAWLHGLVFGPWEPENLPEMAARTELPIRFYPDITHSVGCQYPVPDWDQRGAMTLGREFINPRPVQEKFIHNKFTGYTVGTLTYSEGINDDLNKFLWSAQDWDPESSAKSAVRDFCALLIDGEYASELTHGIFLLEENLEGSMVTNDRIDLSFRLWTGLEAKAPRLCENYRFLMCLLRAYYDYYQKTRAIYHAALERQAADLLEGSDEGTIRKNAWKAVEILKRSETEPVGGHLKKRILELGRSLYEKIGAQLDVKEHKAISYHRGAFLEALDIPLNNSPWMLKCLYEALQREASIWLLAMVRAMLNRENPGPGGYYSSMGEPSSFKHLVRSCTWEDDPEYFSHPQMNHQVKYFNPDSPLTARGVTRPYAFGTLAWCKYEDELEMTFDRLEDGAEYAVRVSYPVQFGSYGIKMYASGAEATDHKLLNTAEEVLYLLPRNAVKNGRLHLRWTTPKGVDGPGLYEIWVIRAENLDLRTEED